MDVITLRPSDKVPPSYADELEQVLRATSSTGAGRLDFLAFIP